MSKPAAIGHNRPETLRNLLAYNADTGSLTWLPRPQSMFATRRAWAAWNARYSGSPALDCDDGRGYRHGRVFRKFLFAHRAAWMIHYGEIAPVRIDHINGDPADNRILNLRAVSNRENGRNAKRCILNTSGVTGVCWARRERRYKAYINGPNGREWLGTFKSLAAATAARAAAGARHGYHENHGRPM